jgi:hypothetical protein
MKRKKLMANQVVARGERLGDRRLPVKILEDLRCSPVTTAERRGRHTFWILVCQITGCLILTFLVNLEELVRHFLFYRSENLDVP